MTTKSVDFSTVKVGPESWRNATLKNIKLSQAVVLRSNKHCDIGRACDPLPQLRDTIAQLSNEEIHRYGREVRAIVARLRESLLQTNEEIKSLTRGKEGLEKVLEHIRKDIRMNKDSQEMRLSRPVKERETDGADDLLNAERAHLLNLKKSLESQLQAILQQLQLLDDARRHLLGILQERSRVLDLICHTSNSMPAASNYNNSSMNGVNNSNNSTHNAYNVTTSAGYTVDPLGAYTPDTDRALSAAQEARSRSAYLRGELRMMIDRTEKLQKAAHKSVNDGLTQKLAETTTLRQHLGVSLGENRHALHRSQRWYDSTERARSFTQGPVQSADLTTRERLDRPLVRVHHRHPGTQLPEAQHLLKGGDGLLQSLANTSRNIGLLRITQFRLHDDTRSKSASSHIDGSIIRLRRRKGDHRWTLGDAF